MPLLALLGFILALVGVLGLLNALTIGTIVSVILLCAGVVLIILDPQVRSRF